MFKTIFLFLLIAFAMIHAEDPGQAAFQKASSSNKFLLALFHEGENAAKKTEPLKEAVQSAVEAVSDRAEAVFLDTSDKNQQALVQQYTLRYAPKPIVLVIAPNGTVVNSFTGPFELKDLTASFPGPSMLKCMKELQSGKLLLISIQNDKSIGGKEASEAVKGFLNDARFKNYSASITIDPSSSADADAFTKLQLNPNNEKAVTMLLAPPGSVVGKWEGKVSQNEIAGQLMQVMARSRSCGSSSCADPSCPPAPAQGGGQ